MLHYRHLPYLIISTWTNRQNLKKLSYNNKEINKTSIKLDHHVPNSILAISVVAAIICVRAHVNAPFHRIKMKIIMFLQYLIDKTVQVHRQIIRRHIVAKKFEYFLDFILSTNHLRHYLFDGYSFEIKTKRIFNQNINQFLLTLLLITFCFPITFAKNLSATNKNSDSMLLNNYTLPFTYNLSVQKPRWNAGCCIKSNQTICNSNFYSSILIQNTFSSNNSSTSPFLFDAFNNMLYNDGTSTSISDFSPSNYDYIKNKTLFCQRFNEFRYLSSNHLAVFTYIIVIIGIIFNSFIFLVLICGSLRRSTSFTLFLALTCFDLLSLASSLFALLFRTVMTYLKTSAPFCKMFGIFFLYFRQCSSATLLLIAVERCIVIKYPFCRYIFDKFRLPLLACIMLMYAVPIPFDFIFYTSGTLHCEAFDTLHAHRYQIFRGFFTVFTYAMIPFVGISISNLLIIIELRKSRKRFRTKGQSETHIHLSTSVMDKRGTTVMLFVASFAFLLLLGPFYIHWCITYKFFNLPECHFTRNLYENIQVCMGVFHPYLTVIEKGMRELNHAANFLLYMATSARFRSDFQRICRYIFYRIFGSAIIFLFKNVCTCCTPPSCIASLERNVSDTSEQESTFESNRKNQTAYKTSHYYSNFERRRKNQLLQATLLNNTNNINNNNNTTTSGSTLTPAASLTTLSTNTGKTVRTLTWNPYDPLVRQAEARRQAARLSRHFSTSGAV